MIHLTRWDLAVIWGVPSILVGVAIWKTLQDDKAFSARMRQRAIDEANDQ